MVHGGAPGLVVVNGAWLWLLVLLLVLAFFACAGELVGGAELGAWGDLCLAGSLLAWWSGGMNLEGGVLLVVLLGCLRLGLCIWLSCWGVEPGGGLGVLPSVELATAGFGAVNLDAECVLGWWFGMNLRGGCMWMLGCLWVGF